MIDATHMKVHPHAAGARGGTREMTRARTKEGAIQSCTWLWMRMNRKEQRSDDKAIYKLRHLVENAFLHLKRWRRVAARYAKNAASFRGCPYLLHRFVGHILVMTLSRKRHKFKSPD